MKEHVHQSYFYAWFPLSEYGNEEICSTLHVEMNKNRYVVSVGWDKSINIYSDSPDQNTEAGIHRVNYPQLKWSDDEVCGSPRIAKSYFLRFVFSLHLFTLKPSGYLYTSLPRSYPL